MKFFLLRYRKEMTDTSRNVRSDYEFLTRLTAGTFGEIYEVRNLRTREICIIKHSQAEKRLFCDVLREINAYRALQHPHIVPLRDVYFNYYILPSDGSHIHFSDAYLVFPRYKQNLLEWMQKKRDSHSKIPMATIRRIMWQLLSAVAHMHIRGFIHDDITPRNILLDEKENIYLMDFGLTKYVGHRFFKVQEICQAEPWRAPENFDMALMPTLHDYSSDMWGVGCIFAELLANGERLFPESVSAQWRSHLTYSQPPDGGEAPVFRINWNNMKTVPWPFAKRLKPKTRDLLEGLLHVMPARRLFIYQALEHAYFAEKLYIEVFPRPLWQDNITHMKSSEEKRRKYVNREYCSPFTNAMPYLNPIITVIRNAYLQAPKVIDDTMAVPRVFWYYIEIILRLPQFMIVLGDTLNTACLRIAAHLYSGNLPYDASHPSYREYACEETRIMQYFDFRFDFPHLEQFITVYETRNLPCSKMLYLIAWRTVFTSIMWRYSLSDIAISIYYIYSQVLRSQLQNSQNNAEELWGQAEVLRTGVSLEYARDLRSTSDLLDALAEELNEAEKQVIKDYKMQKEWKDFSSILPSIM